MKLPFKLLTTLFLFAQLLSNPAFALTLTDKEATIFAEKIWHNEGAGKSKYLTHWNKHETFASLGMGHFIWYPASVTNRPYQESFPALLAFYRQKNVAIPSWLNQVTHSPWASRAAFYADFNNDRLTELRQWLKTTFPTQTYQTKKSGARS